MGKVAGVVMFRHGLEIRHRPVTVSAQAWVIVHTWAIVQIWVIVQTCAKVQICVRV